LVAGRMLRNMPEILLIFFLMEEIYPSNYAAFSSIRLRICCCKADSLIN
jgi:hypothetical protein